ncbi:MAG: Asp23/Gls24 family envelope stress response protein [Gaiellaceae bacterium]
MEGQDSLISPAVLAGYAADAAREVEGVAGLSDGPLHRGKGVTVSGDEDTLAVDVMLELEWGRSAAAVAHEVQRRVAEYLERMANMSPASVDVVFDRVSSPPSKR